MEPQTTAKCSASHEQYVKSVGDALGIKLSECSRISVNPNGTISVVSEESGMETSIYIRERGPTLVHIDRLDKSCGVGPSTDSIANYTTVRFSVSGLSAKADQMRI